MKKLLLLSILLTFSCSNEFPLEILGKYYNSNDGGYVELKGDKTFSWVTDGESVVSGTYLIKAAEYNTLGYDGYYTIITDAESGIYSNQWGVTDHIRHRNGSYDLKQDISGTYFIFSKK